MYTTIVGEYGQCLLALEGDNPKPGGRVLAAAQPTGGPALQMQWLWLLWPQTQGLAILNPAYGLFVTARPTGSPAVSTIDARAATPDQAFVWNAPGNFVVRLAANNDRNLRSPDNAPPGAPVAVGAWEHGKPNELWNAFAATGPTEVRPAVLAFQVISHNNLAISIGEKDPQGNRWTLVLADPDPSDRRQHWLWVGIPPPPTGDPSAAMNAVLYNPAYDAVVVAGISPFDAYASSYLEWQQLFYGGWQTMPDGVVRWAMDTNCNLTAGPNGKAGSPVQALDEWHNGQPYELWTTTQVAAPTLAGAPPSKPA